MSQEKVFQVRNNPNVQFWEVTQEEQEKLVNICGWQGRVLFTQPVAPSVTVDTPEFRKHLRGFLTPDGNVWPKLIAHIDQHATEVAAKAVAEALHDHDTESALRHIDKKIDTLIDELSEEFGISAPQQHAQAALSEVKRYYFDPYGMRESKVGAWVQYENVATFLISSQQPVAAPAAPALTVLYGAMPESSGAQNFTAVLTRKDAKGMDRFDGFTFARSEYPDRVRYEADCMRHLIGELDKEPDLLDYDETKHSGYTEPAAAPAVQVQSVGCPDLGDAEEFAAMLKTHGLLLTQSIQMVDGCMDETQVEPEDAAAWKIVRSALTKGQK